MIQALRGLPFRWKFPPPLWVLASGKIKINLRNAYMTGGTFVVLHDGVGIAVLGNPEHRAHLHIGTSTHIGPGTHIN